MATAWMHVVAHVTRAMAACDIRLQVATKQKLDLTDAFEEAAGSGRDALLGLMAKNRFATALGLMFKGEVTKQAITAICAAYGAGDPDPREPGTFVQVSIAYSLDLQSCAHGLQPPEPGLQLCVSRCSSRSSRSTSTTSSCPRRQFGMSNVEVPGLLVSLRTALATWGWLSRLLAALSTRD